MEVLAADIRKAIVRIKVIGVGGGGNSVLLRLAEDKIPGIELIAVNTDAKQLSILNEAGIEAIQIGEKLTKGRGTGGVASVGAQAAEAELARLETELRDADLIFITAGMGGGVGTGASPVIARLVRQLGILSIGVVTAPFSFEGKRKQRIAQEGIEAMRAEMDALIVVQNDNLMKLPENKRMTLVQSFKAADGILRQAILCISEVILTTGVINVDFADVKTIFRKSESSDALLGIGESVSGRAVEAVQRAIESPLVERSLAGARGIILNISGDDKLALYEVNEAMLYISENAHPDVEIIFGTVADNTLGDKVRATLVATDFVDSESPGRAPAQSAQVVGGQRGETAAAPSVQAGAPAGTQPAPQWDRIPSFMERQGDSISPLTMRTDNGDAIPSFRPKR
ncbi:MAG: cell division protein FtsZ [Schwartzia sp.]|nr:cell division protein FtsZ [Schwartzia sp. (in: firmicutes)]